MNDFETFKRNLDPAYRHNLAEHLRAVWDERDNFDERFERLAEMALWRVSLINFVKPKRCWLFRLLGCK